MTSERKCSASGCCAEPSSENAELYSFPLPTSLISIVHKGKTVYFSRRRIWLNRLGIEETSLDKNSAVCSLHFVDDDFTVSEKGEKMLKESALPSKNLPPNANQDPFDLTQQENNEEGEYGNENEIETVEKSDDDDDDIEIIEPQREVITLDDDECEEESSKKDSNTQTKTPEKNTEKNSDKKSVGSKRTLVLRTVTEKELNGRKLIPVAKGTNSPFKILKIANNSASNQEVGAIPSAVITADGKKYTVQVPSKSQLRKLLPKPLTPESAEGKFVKLKTVRTLQSIDKESPVYKLQLFSGKNGEALSDKEVSEAVKEQLSELVQKRPGLRKTLEVDKNLENVAKVPVKIVSPQELKNLKLTPVPSDLVKKTLRKAEKMESTKKKQTEAVSEPNKTILNKTVLIPNKKFKIKENSGGRKEKAPLKKTPGKSQEGLGFTEIYDFINEEMINFSFEVFGTKYLLRGCTLNFEAFCGSKKSMKTADISDSSLSSTDPFLLNGMNVSLGMSNKSLNHHMFSKTVGHKFEKIERVDAEYGPAELSIPMECEVMARKVDGRTADQKRKSKRKQFIETRVDTPESSKIVLHPIMPQKKKPIAVDPPKTNAAMIKETAKSEAGLKVVAVQVLNKSPLGEKRLDAVERRKVMKKKRNAEISRKILNMAISQMNPNLRGRFLVTNTKFKKSRKVVQSGPNQQKTDHTSDTRIASTKSSPQSLSSDPVSPKRGTPSKTTRRSVAKVKNYKNLNSYGTTDEKVVEEITMARKKKAPLIKPAKRMKYSDKVGHIESFLEVVLEPDNKVNELEEDFNKKDPLDPTEDDTNIAAMS